MTHFFSRRYFVSPPYVTLDDYTAMPELGIKTYTEYDYLTPGIASFLRTGHFEYALRLTREYFHKCNVIDFGCADGPFLPSLSRYFNHVVGVDMRPVDVQIAEKVIGAAGLSNVEVVCNRGLRWATSSPDWVSGSTTSHSCWRPWNTLVTRLTSGDPGSSS